MDNKKWFNLLISILCIAAVIGGYVFGYKPYAEKKLLRDNYNIMVSVYDDIKQYSAFKDAKTNKETIPLSEEKKSVRALKTNLNEITGKLTTNNNKIALNLMLQATKDLDELITTKRSEWNVISGKGKGKALDFLFKTHEQQTKLETITLPKIKGYVE